MMDPTPDEDRAHWLTIEQATVAYGWSERTIRRKLAAGALPAYKLPSNAPVGFEWRIAPPRREPPPDATPPPSTMLALADVERLLAPVVQERDRLLTQVADLQAARLADAESHSEARRADAIELGRLQGRLEAAEAELSRLRAATPPPAAPGPTPETEGAPPASPPPRRRWFWER